MLGKNILGFRMDKKMNILITGTARGIGKAAAEKFLSEGHVVWGFDIDESSINHPLYVHYHVDVRHEEEYPEGLLPHIIVNNAGVQDSGDDISVNLKGI